MTTNNPVDTHYFHLVYTLQTYRHRQEITMGPFFEPVKMVRWRDCPTSRAMCFHHNSHTYHIQKSSSIQLSFSRIKLGHESTARHRRHYYEAVTIASAAPGRREIALKCELLWSSLPSSLQL